MGRGVGDAPLECGLIFVIPFLGRVFLGDEAVGFGAFGLAECRFDEVDVKGVLDALLDGGGRGVKIDAVRQGFRKRNRVVVEFAPEAFLQAGLVVGQEVRDALVFCAEQERAVLQERVADALLRAADEFAALECDFVLRGATKTRRGENFAARRGLCVSAGFKGRIHPEQANAREQARADFAIGFADVAPHRRIVSRADHAIRQFMPVQNRAPTGWATDDIHAEGANFSDIDLALDALGVPKGHRGRLPPVNANRGPRARGNCAHEGLVCGHIKKGVSIRGIEETPCPGVAMCHVIVSPSV